MDNYRQFVLELQTNFCLHDPVGDVERQLDHLMMTDGQQITKYVMEFNHIAFQFQGYGEGALQHHFYNGLSDHIKDEISCIGKPTTLSGLQQLAQAIDARYWECKSQVSCQMKPTAVSSALKNSPNTTPTVSKDTKESKGKAATTSSTSGAYANNPDLTSKLGKNGKLTTAERKHHFNNKLCILCSLAEHMAKDCPKSTSQVSKGHTVITTPEAKLEVSLEAKN